MWLARLCLLYVCMRQVHRAASARNSVYAVDRYAAVRRALERSARRGVQILGIIYAIWRMTPLFVARALLPVLGVVLGSARYLLAALLHSAARPMFDATLWLLDLPVMLAVPMATAGARGLLEVCTSSPDVALAVLVIATSVVILPARNKTDEQQSRPPARPPRIPHRFICPITHEIMRHPVVAADGMSYEEEAVKRWLATSWNSPLTGARLPHREVVANFNLRAVIDEWENDRVDGYNIE